MCYNKNMDKQKLELLIEQKYTISQLASHFSVGKSTIRYWVKKYNLSLYRGARGKYPKDHILIRKCSCGETDPNKFYGNKAYFCSNCHNKYTLKKGQEKRIKMIDYLGGKCSNCQFSKYKTALQVHHLDPTLKDSRWTQSRGWSWERILKELQTCILLCSNCHNAYHGGELDLSEL